PLYFIPVSTHQLIITLRPTSQGHIPVGLALHAATQALTVEQHLIGLRAVALICQYMAPWRELHLIQTIPQKLTIMYVGWCRVDCYDQALLGLR
ncbi:MAG: hypothetical protein RL012_90, partial [Bacteroidota bacterium]